MNELQRYFEGNTGNCIDKWSHYFEVYDFWFKRYRDKPVVILEIGVYQGGSLQMWKHYFGKEAKIYAVDINPACKQFEEENIEIFTGSQEDREFLKAVKAKMPKVDILIDDGGHSMTQQIITFEEMYGHIKNDGIYLCEDLHTSYWKNYGGGHKKTGTFIEYSKKLIDSLNAWHARNKSLEVNEFSKTTFSMHYYPSILVIEKKPMKAPTSKRKGEMIIPTEEFPLPTIHKSILSRISDFLKMGIKRVKKKSVRLVKG